MANWITHQFIAQRILDAFPYLSKKEFCIGSIAPDCNMENADWTSFTPSREVTHFMQGKRKSFSDCQWFLDHFLAQHPISTPEEASFWWGYYAHLIADAAYQHLLCDDPVRTKAMWIRMTVHPLLQDRIAGYEPSWANAKQLIPLQERKNDIDSFEAAILNSHPDCPYLTTLPAVSYFPDYAPFLPSGAILRKLNIMYCLPDPKTNMSYASTLITRDEYFSYIERATEHCIYCIRSHLSLTPVFHSYFLA